MPKNQGIIDILPKNQQVLDILPKNQSMDIGESLTDRLYTVVLAANMYLGIPPYTYTTAGTVTSSYSP